MTDPALRPTRGDVPHFLLSNHDDLGPPRQPLVRFEVREAPTRIAALPGSGDLIVTLFGDKRPVTGPEGPRRGESWSVCGCPAVRLIRWTAQSCIARLMLPRTPSKVPSVWSILETLSWKNEEKWLRERTRVRCGCLT